jgi:hypothetical protein
MDHVSLLYLSLIKANHTINSSTTELGLYAAHPTHPACSMSLYVRPANLTAYIAEIEAEKPLYANHLRQAQQDFPRYANTHVVLRHLIRLMVALAHICHLRLLRTGYEQSERYAMLAIGRVPLPALEAALPAIGEVETELRRTYAAAFV